MILKLAIVALLLLQLVNPFPTFPLYKQCDSNWGSQTLGFGPDTICQAGCLMTSVTMMLHGYGITVDSNESIPPNVNNWLKNHGGYVSGDEFVWASVDSLGTKFGGFITPQQVVDNFNAGHVVILNVDQGHHYVLMTGVVSDSEFAVNDPGFSRTSYALTDVVRASIYIPPSSQEQILQ
eukprot:TRINITY_DN4100_c0_g1_i1.p1 TRINITY_DN4100_c0_g1~~TRINITY_DN4100_c0_g1_i1.p1  ORF type:complete len:179 (+),score=30.56 TRINITY_DN4100_c0_g1_i1:192-728(+)